MLFYFRSILGSAGDGALQETLWKEVRETSGDAVKAGLCWPSRHCAESAYAASPRPGVSMANVREVLGRLGV